MALQQMRTTIGDAKVDLWLESGKLISRPDRITGSTKPEHLEYLIPTTYTNTVDRNTDGLEGKNVKDDLSKQDIENIEGLRVNLLQPDSAAGSSGDGAEAAPLGDKPGAAAQAGAGGKAGVDAKVKAEPGVEDEAKIKAFLDNPGASLDTLQKASNICKMLFAQVGL